MKQSVAINEAGQRLRKVDGRHHPLIKELRGAFASNELTEDGCCAIEGMRVIEEAIRSGLKFKTVFFSSSAENRAQRLLPQLAPNVEALLLPNKLFASVSASETPQGVAALVHCRRFSLEDVVVAAKKGPLLAVVGVQDPGNLGTILRSAEAFGAGGVLLGEGTVSRFNSKVIRASAGSVFRLPVARTDLRQSVAELRAFGLRLIATSSHKANSLYETQLSGPLAIFIGSEGGGVPRELLAQIDEVVAIPHSSKVESLNAGVAASIILYEAARQRGIKTTLEDS
jgi:TrmH family RNA methyltransferase